MAVTYSGGSVPVTGVTWTWTQPFAADRFFLNGSGTRAQPIANGLATVTGTMDSEYFDQTFYAAFRSGAFASLVCTATGTTAISGAEFPTFTNTFSAIQIRGSPRRSAGLTCSTCRSRSSPRTTGGDGAVGCGHQEHRFGGLVSAS
jgi:hypothetical protein